MPAIEKHAPGSFCWFELGTTDQNAAKQFYGALFGWAAEDSPMGPDSFYTMFKLEGRDTSAAYTLNKETQDQGIPPHWLLYIAVESADKTAKLAKEKDGTVMASPFDVMTHGRMAVIKDPTGAAFSIWEPKSHTGTGVAGIDGTVVWADLSTPEPEKAMPFYQEVFGWKLHKSGNDPSGYQHIQNGEQYIGGVPPQHAVGTPPHWLLYFQTPSCDASTAKVQELGGRVYVPPNDVPNAGRFSIVADPQGAVFALWQSVH